MARTVVRPTSLAPTLMVTMTVATMVIPSLGVLASFVIDEFEITRTQFGWLMTSIAAVTATTAPLAGRLADQLGGRRLVLLLAGTIAVCTAAIAAAPTLPVLVAVAMVSGFPNAAGNPAANKIIVDQLPVGGRGITMGLKQSGVQLGFLVIGLTLPTLALQIGWRGSFLTLTGFAVVVLLTAQRLLPDDPPRPTAPSTGRYRMSPDVRWLTGYAVLMGTAGSTISTFLPLYSQEAVGLGPAAAGATVALLGLVGVASRVYLARFVERLERFSIPLGLLAWGAAMAVGLVLAAASWQPWMVWAGAFVAGLSAMAWNAIANLAAITAVDGPAAGRASGSVNFGFMAGFTVGPVAFGWLVDRSGSYDAAWAASVAVFVVAALLMHTWSHTDRSRSGMAEELRTS